MRRLADPELQAACDRVVYDCANLIYAASRVPSFDEPVCGGWTARQAIRHLAAIARSNAAGITRMVQGLPPAEESLDLGAPNAEHVGDSAARPINQLLDDLRRGRDTWLSAIAASAESLEASRHEDFIRQVRGSSTHYLAHGLDLAEGFEAVRYDGFVLNCLLYASHGVDELLARQQAILLAAGEHFGDEDEDEDDG